MPRCLLVTACVLVLAWAQPAHAQFGGLPFSDPATGETWRVEIGGSLWNPTPAILISSESLGIAGSDIDLVADLGIARRRLRELRVTARPARTHKFRLHYIPIVYEAETTLTRTLVFNGIRYTGGLPVVTQFKWHAWRFGYEWDFVYRDRGFVGLILEAKYTDVRAELASPLAIEFARARAPIPAIGGIGRVYVAPNISLTGELTGFRLPERINDDYRGHYADFDLYGTVNFSDQVGVQMGYRSIDVMYRVNDDAGDLALRGLYFSGVLRF